MTIEKAFKQVWEKFQKTFMDLGDNKNQITNNTMNTLKNIEEIVEQILVDIINCDGEQEVREMLQEHLTTLTQYHEAEVRKVVEAERERIAVLCYQADTVEDVYYLIFNDNQAPTKTDNQPSHD